MPIDWEDSHNRRRLEDALVRVCPSPTDLEIFVDRALNKNLKTITCEGNIVRDTFRLVSWARTEGRIDELYNRFCDWKERSPAIIQLKRELSDSPPSSEPTHVYSDSGKQVHNASLKNSVAPIEVFVSYTHKDEAFKDVLHTHLSNLIRQEKISIWQDRAIEAGAMWESEINARLESSSIILLLITRDFMASDYCYNVELKRAIERSNEGTARAIAIILEPCDWKDAPFSNLQVLPKDAKAVTTWDNEQTAWVNVVNEIRRVVATLLS